jgi:K+-sensing histidine kinase KdpD
VTRLDARIDEQGAVPTSRRPPVVSTDAWISMAAILAPIAVAAALIPWRTSLDTADCALLLVVVIVAVASTGRRIAALLAALVAALSFDFFLTRPYYSLRITRHQDLITELLLLVVGVAVGELAARGRGHRREAADSQETVALLHSVTELVATGQEPQDVIRAAQSELRQLLALRDCFFTRRDPGSTVARITPRGELTVAGQTWSTEDLGLPTSRVDLPVRAQGWLLGHFVLAPTRGRPVTAQHLLAAVAIADLVGAVLFAEESGSGPEDRTDRPGSPDGEGAGARRG